MTLYIDTEATDITNAAVVSVTDDTPVEELKQLVPGDSEPLTVQFTSNGAAPSWASSSSYVLTVALGFPTPAGIEDLASTSTFTLNGSTRTGSLALTGAQLINTLRLWLGNYPWRRTGIGMSLQVRIATPTGANITYAQLPVIVQAPVILITPAEESAQPTLDSTPTAGEQPSASGNLTVTPASQIHIETITPITGVAGTRAVIITAAGLQSGARVSVRFILPATDSIVFELRNLTVGGTLLETITSQADGFLPAALVNLWFDGTNFNRESLIQPASGQQT